MTTETLEVKGVRDVTKLDHIKTQSCERTLHMTDGLFLFRMRCTDTQTRLFPHLTEIK